MNQHNDIQQQGLDSYWTMATSDCGNNAHIYRDESLFGRMSQRYLTSNEKRHLKGSPIFHSSVWNDYDDLQVEQRFDENVKQYIGEMFKTRDKELNRLKSKVISTMIIWY